MKLRGWRENRDYDNCFSDFYWLGVPTGSKPKDWLSNIRDGQLVNRFQDARCLTTKVRPGSACLYVISRRLVANKTTDTARNSLQAGLLQILTNVRWACDIEVDTFAPRAYCLAAEEDRKLLAHDFVLTAAESLVKLVAEGLWSSQLREARR
jgi:hypothetical protein